MKRKKRPELEMIQTARRYITLNLGQCFYETLKAYEIWQEKPLFRIKRISKKQVFWVFEKKDRIVL